MIGMYNTIDEPIYSIPFRKTTRCLRRLIVFVLVVLVDERLLRNDEIREPILDRRRCCDCCGYEDAGCGAVLVFEEPSYVR